MKSRILSVFVAEVIAGLWLAGTCAAGDAAGTVNRPAPGRIRYQPDRANAIEVPPTRARFVRVVIRSCAEGAASLDEVEVYGPDGTSNLARAGAGAVASASSTIAGYAIHRPENLNDGRYGNDHGWVAATTGEEWVQVELPAAAMIARVVLSRDRTGTYRDRRIGRAEIRTSLDGRGWSTLREVVSDDAPRVIPSPLSWDALLRYAFLCERDTWATASRDDALSPWKADRPAIPGGPPYWKALAELDPIGRNLRLMRELADRLAAKGLDVARERGEIASLDGRRNALKPEDPDAEEALYLDIRVAKRRLFLRDPELASGLSRILFVKRHPFASSHNYSDILDSTFRAGGGICRLDIPTRDGRLDPASGTVTTLFASPEGIARDPVADFDARTIYFAYRPGGAERKEESFWHLRAMDASGGPARQLTSGPFHDDYPCPLPDGRLAFISTRCRARFLCWRPQAFVLFAMDADGRPESIRALSHANLSEWAPTVHRDGQILWTRSEYLDKGADFGHTLWLIRPDGTNPTLLFGNNTRNCYVNAHDVPDGAEVCCTLFSHGGDHNGPIGLIDAAAGPFRADAVTNITPDVRPRYHMEWAARECFRDPSPISRDLILVSHAPGDVFGLYAIDRYGNRELLYLDPTIGSMSPTPLRPRPKPPVIPAEEPNPGLERLAGDEPRGEFFLADVYRGLEPAVARGSVRYLRICEEVRSELERKADGSYRDDHEAFQDFYASPTHLVTGPNGWPSYVAKAVVGTVPVEPDGSARFVAPAGKVLYFQALDGDRNELQRMRSVVQLQPGERRGCVGCHEHRTDAPASRPALPRAMAKAPSVPEPPSWGAGPFSYERVVQPVWDRRCVSCHDAGATNGLNLAGTLDADRIPASYRTLIQGGWVHHFDLTWGREHEKAAPRTFGTLQSRLWKTLEAPGGHHGTTLTADERHRITCWIDLNCPLWPDYTFRLDRPKSASVVADKGQGGVH
ncbi:discoidin domain-containing protein [Aquisphaera insulae]|uniref:HzsA-related protein n=1 Tax=Aquisphaera insulae TaxID=2712864 RepID=UPI0013EC3E8C|nr:discoidin domain-containing protein [Aquisphaera insulae]